MLNDNELSAFLSLAEATDTLLKQLNAVSEKLKPLKPEVKSFRIDYLNRNSEVKFLLFIPPEVRTRVQKEIEIPPTTGFRFDEMWELDNMTPVNNSWAFDGTTWQLDVTKLPATERYWLTVKSRISMGFLKELVSVRVAENPSREKENDRYWIHSALKDVEVFERIWSELSIEQVNADVRIGVERMFSSAIPKGLKDKLELQQRLLNAIAKGNRDEEQQLKFRYRTSPPTVTPTELNRLLGGLTSEDTFSEYIYVKLPFVVSNIEPISEVGMFTPEKVKVGVQTDLNYRMPAAKGDLCFYRHKYSQLVSEKVKTLLSKEK